MKIQNLLAAGLAVALSSTLPLQASPGTNVQVGPYFPAFEGARMTYASKLHGAEKLRGQVEVEQRDGKNYTFYRIKGSNGDFLSLQFSMDLGSGQVALEKIVTDNDGTISLADDPVMFSTGPHTQVGDQYQSVPKDYVNPVTGGNIQWKVRTRRVEELPVGRMPFYRTLRYDISNVDTASGAKISDMRIYFAPGLGPVRLRGRFLSRTFDMELQGIYWPDPQGK